jgi:hypothetical protein
MNATPESAKKGEEEALRNRKLGQAGIIISVLMLLGGLANLVQRVAGASQGEEPSARALIAYLVPFVVGYVVLRRSIVLARKKSA